jgi:hypothetical protein
MAKQSKKLPGSPVITDEVRKVADIRPDPRNAKKHSESQIAQIVQSIERFGFVEKLVIRPNGQLISGEGRLEALKRVGREQVECRVVSGLNEAGYKALGLALNRIGENSRWDEDVLREILGELQGEGENPLSLGFSPTELDKILAEPAGPGGARDRDRSRQRRVLDFDPRPASASPARTGGSRTGMSVEGKVVAITGASGGIGEATALLLAESGAKLVLGARRSDRLAAHANRIGGAAVHRVTDVRRRGDLTSLVDLARERFGKLDVLVSNAGIGPISPLDALRVDEWEDMVDVNVKGVLYGVAAALPFVSRPGVRALRHRRVYRRAQDNCQSVGLFRHEVRGSRVLRGVAPRGRRQAARNDRHARICSDRLHRIRSFAAALLIEKVRLRAAAGISGLKGQPHRKFDRN